MNDTYWLVLVWAPLGIVIWATAFAVVFAIICACVLLANKVQP